MSSVDQANLPFPPAVGAFLEELREHWEQRGSVLHVIPHTGPSRPGYSCNETHSLVVARLQDFGVEWPGGALRAREDEAILAPRDRAYRHRWDERRRRYPALVIAGFEDDVVVHQRNAPEERWGEVTWRFDSGTGRVVEAALDLALRLTESAAAGRDWATEQLRQLVVTVLAATGDATRCPRRASRGGPAVAVRVRRHLRAHLDDVELDVPAVAAALGYDPRFLGQEFVRETGETIRSALCLMRVQRARELLRRRDLPIAEVAALCGFASASHFSRTFRRIEGHPPRKYRSYGHLEEEG